MCREYAQSHKDAQRLKDAEYYQANRDSILEKAREYRESKAEQVRLSHAKYYQKNKDSISKQRKWSNKLNRRKLTQYNNRYIQKRRAEDPMFDMLLRLRRRLHRVLARARAKKASRTSSMLGCSAQEFMEHIQRQFKPGMCWNNRHLWHIDHIRPCCSFDLLEPEQQRQCFHFSNLQPLWASENIAKRQQDIQTALQMRGQQQNER